MPHQPGRGLTKSLHHFLVALPRLDGGTGTEDLTSATRTAAAEINTFWTGPRVPEVRMLPARLPAKALPEPEGDLRVCLGLDEKRLAPVWHDFEHVPHLMVFGDAETGKTNTLRLAIDAITARYDHSQARILLGDPSRALIESVPPRVPDRVRRGHRCAGQPLGQRGRLPDRAPARRRTAARAALAAATGGPGRSCSW